IVHEPNVFVTAIGAGTTYPDYKPAPFIVSSEVDGVDMVTVVTEGIFSYCGVKVKIDTDRYLGPETATVRAEGEAIGHVTTSEYGSQMLSLGGVHHLTGGSRKEGRVTCDALMALSNCKPVELTLDAGPLLPGRRSRHRLGRHQYFRSAVGAGAVQSEGGAARPDHADGLDHRRTRSLLRARRGAAAGRDRDAARSETLGRAHSGKL